MDRIERIAREFERGARLLVAYEQRFRRHCFGLADEIVTTILARYPDAIERELIFDTYTGAGDTAWPFWVASITLPGCDEPGPILVTFKWVARRNWLDPRKLLAFRSFTEPFTVGPCKVNAGTRYDQYHSADVDECWHMAFYLGQNLRDVLIRPRETERSPK